MDWWFNFYLLYLVVTNGNIPYSSKLISPSRNVSQRCGISNCQSAHGNHVSSWLKHKNCFWKKIHFWIAIKLNNYKLERCLRNIRFRVKWTFYWWLHLNSVKRHSKFTAYKYFNPNKCIVITFNAFGFDSRKLQICERILILSLARNFSVDIVNRMVPGRYILIARQML